MDSFTAADTDPQGAAMSPTTGLPKSSHSFFNKALREALAFKGKNIQDIYQFMLKSKTLAIVCQVKAGAYEDGLVKGALQIYRQGQYDQRV